MAALSTSTPTPWVVRALSWSAPVVGPFITGVRSSNELQWLDLKIWHQDSSTSNDRQENMPHFASPAGLLNSFHFLPCFRTLCQPRVNLFSKRYPFFDKQSKLDPPVSFSASIVSTVHPTTDGSLKQWTHLQGKLTNVLSNQHCNSMTV